MTHGGPFSRPLVIPVQNRPWSDWGTKENTLDTVTALGLQPQISV